MMFNYPPPREAIIIRRAEMGQTIVMKNHPQAQASMTALNSKSTSNRKRPVSTILQTATDRVLAARSFSLTIVKLGSTVTIYLN
jgi:hypothetical protein